MIFSEELGTSDTENTTFTAMTGSPYTPPVNGRLIQVKLYWSQTAATSILSAATARLESPIWGVPLEVTIQGAGIVTAPAFPPIPGIQNCDLPVKTGVKITLSVKHEAGVTAVTSNLKLVGVFEA